VKRIEIGSLIGNQQEGSVRLSIFALMLLVPMACHAEEPTTTIPAFWGTPTVDNGACCETLGEVRKNIDRLDREIVRLMAERGRYVHEAARFKANPAQVEAPERADTPLVALPGIRWAF
jgi:isochorismate pyruvate lyase